jgi:hypothetical protein
LLVRWLHTPGLHTLSSWCVTTRETAQDSSARRWLAERGGLLLLHN